uniref:Uncharacterized protein n=1 Tax=Romanomermis culicivorax TaxID=13658 RepID=A0A915JK04_ROMCU
MKAVTIVSVTSTCPLTFDAFTKAGVYWCLACSYIAENATTCDMQNTNVPPTGSGTTAVFELQGNDQGF